MPRRNARAVQGRSRISRKPRTVKVLTPSGKWEDATILHEGRWAYTVRNALGEKFIAIKPEHLH